MSFISTAAHQKFILLCQNIISTNVEINDVVDFDENSDRLKTDLTELQKLMDSYLNMLAEFPKITCMYYNLHRNIRINIRKLQIKKSRSNRRKLE